MLTRILGKTGLKVSAIGFGAWNIGGQWGDVSDETALATIQAAFDAGVTFFDTADAYGEPVGRSEELIGRGLKGKRDRVVIATKVGNFARRQGQALAYTHPLHVELCCDASLNRMKIDTIDVYQCHLGNPPQPEIFFEAFETLVRKGKIRHWGISTNDVNALRTFNRTGGCATVQLDYSLVNREPERDVLPYAQGQNLGVIIRGPLAMGLLGGKFTPQTIFDDSVRKGWNEGDGRTKYLERLAKVDANRNVLQTPNRTLAAGGLQFVLAHPAVSVAIPGTSPPSRRKPTRRRGGRC
ncbi:MAG: aldo/keto reductase [Tepidisphaeraceae bacterium]